MAKQADSADDFERPGRGAQPAPRSRGAGELPVDGDFTRRRTAASDAFGGATQSARQPHVLSVSQLTAAIAGLLEGSFPEVWVSGEISNFSRPQSGHCYFTLKDAEAQIRAVIWRSAAARVKFDLADGLEVVCRGGIDVYPPRGSYQLVVERVEPLGLGALELALRQLQARLAAEGLFDPARKRPLPRFPRRVAVVTSPTGAAIRDFLEVLRRRWGGVDVWVVPTRVQGEGAALEVAAAIARVNSLAQPPDCLVVARGGGSLEDLWTFNEEPVVRAIAGSRVPVVSAVGHEIDVTLADLAADVRALTPSEAAELVAPDADELRQSLAHSRRRLVAALRGRVALARGRLEALSARRSFRKPHERLQQWAQRLDELGARGTRALARRLETARGRADRLAGQLHSLSPLGVLARGYSLTTRADDGSLVRRAAELQPGDLLRTRFHQGIATSRVEGVEPPGE